jgi:hypothetical protein
MKRPTYPDIPGQVGHGNSARPSESFSEGTVSRCETATSPKTSV